MQQQKRKIRSRYVKLGLTIFLAGAGLLMCYYLLYNTADVKGVFSKINGILTPFYLGIIMAYLLCPIYNGTLRIVYRRSRGRLGSYTKDYRLARVIATIVSFTVLMVVLIGFFMLVIPELTRSIVGLVSDVPIYVENAIDWIEKTAVENPDLAKEIEGKIRELKGVHISSISAVDDEMPDMDQAEDSDAPVMPPVPEDTPADVDL